MMGRPSDDPTQDLLERVDGTIESIYAKILPELFELDCYQALMVTITVLTARMLAVTTAACGQQPQEVFESFCHQLMAEYQKQINGMAAAAADAKQTQPH
jgi:hypothetical protein